VDKPGRPKVDDGAIIIVQLGTLRLRRGEDDDLINFFARLPSRKKHAGLKAALRAGGMQTINAEDLSDDEELKEAAESFLE
jgi:hypothetical protein